MEDRASHDRRRHSHRHGVSWKTGWLEGGSGDRTKLPLSVNGLAEQILRARGEGGVGLFDERQFVYR